MKFYNREKELEILRRIQKDSLESARFTVLTGRRRVGKTELLNHAFEGLPYLYFFVARRSEAELCENYRAEVEEKLGIPMPGTFAHISDILRYVLKLAADRPITLVMDEFQDLKRVAPATFSALQGDWDMLKNKARINLVVSGSVNRLMNEIFRNEHEPLYGRETDFLKLSPFRTATLREILLDHAPGATNEDLLALYAFTGGVAKYVELLMQNRAYTRDAMLDVIFREESTFLDEGKLCLSDEFGRDYGNYFSILSTIARGRTARSDLERAVGGNEVGGYLKNLIEEYGLVKKNQPLFDKPGGKNVRYALDDNFYIFWFRFIARYSYMLEAGANERLKELVKRDYPVFAGKMLERYFRQQLIERGTYTRLGSWWDRKGENELDLVAEDELEGRGLFAEVKLDPARASLQNLKDKAETFLRATGEFKDYQLDYRVLSPADM